MWIKAKDNRLDEWLLNTDNISAIHIPSSTVYINAVTGNGDGVLHLAPGEAEKIVSKLGKTPATDLINRQDAIKACEKQLMAGVNDVQKIVNATLGFAVGEIKRTPSAKTNGKWNIIDDCEKFIAKCNQCGKTTDSRMLSNYCPNCGADMRGDKE